MKYFSKIQWLLLLLGALLTSAAEPAKTPPAKPVPFVPVRSAFTIPAHPPEGRDPFFPESTRVYESSATATKHPVQVITLKVKGYSFANGQPVVIINNHSFMINDEGDVLTTGGRVHVRCLEIKPALVVIEANGIKQALHF